ncbi:carboxypeptidase-like regulatory domain-containing protein [Maribacter chungangensis]|uniref:Carboxypeptidase-like regulatory domain-containing protein n=1 Tax=Maribacter chungangensis TaxID=1069117 RepID=A0ABW3B2W1_9FLAO
MRLSFLSLLLFTIYSSQAQLNYTGRIVDAKTQEPLPYVNIGIVDKGFGTVTDETGRFYLVIDTQKFKKEDIVQISSLGYETIKIPIGQIKVADEDFPKIVMQPSDIQLEEVFLYSDALVPITEFVGYRNYGERNFGYWNKDMALGGELATLFSVRSGPRMLNSLEFEVWENPSDSLLVRVNIYDTAGGLLGAPGANLNKSQKNILHTVPNGKNIITVDLNEYEVFVEDDFFVSLEIVKVFGVQKLGLVLAASGREGASFRKYASQGEWEFLSDLHMAFYMETSPYVKQKKAERYEKKVERVRLKKPTLSGFAIFRGKMIANVTVQNQRTKETVQTDESGRYSIEADKKDIILFTKSGYKKMIMEVQNQKFANAILKLESDK